MPALHKEPTRRAWRQPGIPSFSRGSSSCGSPSLCESSLGSQESLQTGFYSPPEHRGGWERAHIMQAPSKEQAELSYLAPVKIGWLPIQRRVVVAGAGNQRQSPDHSAGQVKHLKTQAETFIHKVFCQSSFLETFFQQSLMLSVHFGSFRPSYSYLEHRQVSSQRNVIEQSVLQGINLCLCKDA